MQGAIILPIGQRAQCRRALSAPRQRGDTDNGHGEKYRGDEMPEREPPARKHQPHDIAEKSERSGADVPAE